MRRYSFRPRRRPQGYLAWAPVSSNNLATLRDVPASEVIVLDDPVEFENTTLAAEKIPSTSSGKMEKSLSFRYVINLELQHEAIPISLLETNIEPDNTVINREPAEIVTIITSTPPNQQEFKLPKNVVSHYSPFFETAFKSQFIEGQTQSMTLEDVEGEIFGCMVHWFYTQKVETQSVGTHADDLPKLVKLWILAERCIVPRLQNAAFGHIYNYLNNIFNPFPVFGPVPDALKQVIDVIFNSAEQHDILRKLLVDRCAALSSKTLRTLIPHMPQDLIVGVTIEVSKDRDAGKTRRRMNEVEEYQVKIPGENVVQPAIEKEKSVVTLHFDDLEPSDDDDGHILNSRYKKPLTRPINRPVAVHGLPAAN
jgi:hypothetical protein